MSASGTVERLRTPEGVVYVARVFLGMELSVDCAERYVLKATNQDGYGWMGYEDSVSAGPVLYLKARMMEDGLYEWERPDEPDDLPIIFVSRGKKLIPHICPVARSKIFRTMLPIEPINLITGRVAGFDWLHRRKPKDTFESPPTSVPSGGTRTSGAIVKGDDPVPVERKRLGFLLQEDFAMAVRAKVRCNARTANEVHFTTVYEPDEKRDAENARFTKATPWGDIRMGIDNPTAIEQFEINKEYFVDFTPAQ